MKILLETTKWSDNIPNHTYIVDSDKMIAFISAVDGSFKKFGKPLSFGKKGRSFKELKDKATVQKVTELLQTDT